MKKKLLVVVAALLVVFVLASCAPRVSDLQEQIDAAVQEELEKIETATPAPVEPAEVEGADEVADFLTEDSEEPSKEPSEEPAKEVQQQASADLAADVYSFEVEVDGIVYKLPCAMSEFMADGWELGDDIEGETLEPNQYGMAYMTKGDNRLYVNIVNTGSDVLKPEECELGEVKQDSYDAEDNDVSVILPGGITIGSTYDEVIAAYGEPSDKYEGDSYSSLTYSTGSYAHAEVEVDENGIVDGVEIRNFMPQADGEVDMDNLPDEVAKYSAPTALGDDWSSMNVEFAGDLYTIPAPVSAFVENGWQVVSDASETIDAKGFAVGFEMRKDNQVMRMSLRNFSDSAQPVGGCFVTSLKSSQNEANLPFTLPGGITQDSTQAEVEAAFGTPDEVDDSGSMFDYVTYGSQYGSPYKEISFAFNKEEGGQLWIMEMNSDPKDFPY